MCSGFHIGKGGVHPPAMALRELAELYRTRAQKTTVPGLPLAFVMHYFMGKSPVWTGGQRRAQEDLAAHASELDFPGDKALGFGS